MLVLILINHNLACVSGLASAFNKVLNFDMFIGVPYCCIAALYKICLCMLAHCCRLYMLKICFLFPLNLAHLNFDS